jgi:hypothetical protein
MPWSPDVLGRGVARRRPRVGAAHLLASIMTPPAERYKIDVYQLANVAGSTRVELAGTVSGKSTTFRIPPEIIVPGSGRS